MNTVAGSAGQSSQPEQLETGWTADGIVEELTRLLQTDKRTSKLINPALIFTDRLIEQGVLANASELAWAGIYRAVQQVAFRLRAPHRLLLCLKLYSSLGLVGSQTTAKMAARSLLSHTGHPMPKVSQRTNILFRVFECAHDHHIKPKMEMRGIVTNIVLFCL